MPGDLSNDYELQSIRVKWDRFANFLTACPLNPQEAYIAYNVYVLPSLTYVSLSLFLQQSTIDNIHKRYIPALLPKLGFQATFPRETVYAPKSVVGIGILHLNLLIVQRKIKFIYR